MKLGDAAKFGTEFRQVIDIPYPDVSGGGGGGVKEAQLLIPDGCQVQSAVAGEGYLWSISL